VEGLKAARLSKGLTQLELAQKVGVVRETVSLWESGTNRVNSEMLVRLSEVLECSVDFLCKNTL
jgi:putative transcriptional regulator